MIHSKQTLMKVARENDFKPENLEKVFRLLDILDQLTRVPYLNDRLVLKGGTALNVFHHRQLPRLSVDIDLNYIGQANREDMLAERPVVEEAIGDILLSSGLKPERNPTQYASGKMLWRYDSLLGQAGNLSVDMNYLYRVPLWPVSIISPNISLGKKMNIPVLDIHEVAAGKLSALFCRHVSRDFYDAHYLLNHCKLDVSKLRRAFVVYLSMTELDVDQISSEGVDFSVLDIKRKLLPVLKQADLPRTPKAIQGWADTMRQELRDNLNSLLPLKHNEVEFIHRVRKNGEILPELISEDADFNRRVISHPAVLWSVKKLGDF